MAIEKKPSTNKFMRKREKYNPYKYQNDEISKKYEGAINNKSSKRTIDTVM